MKAFARRRQRGVASIEFALMLLLGLVPLLLFTFSGVLIMAAQQTLATASAEGARASLRYGSAGERRTQPAWRPAAPCNGCCSFPGRTRTAALAAPVPSWSRRRRPAPDWRRCNA